MILVSFVMISISLLTSFLAGNLYLIRLR